MRGKRRDIVQSVGVVEEAAQITRRLADALFVLDQREAQKTLAMLAETFSGRDGEVRLFDQQLGKFETAH